MEEEEAVLVLGGVAEVQLLDPAPRLLEQRGVVGHLRGGGVREVAQDREVDVGVDVAERLHLEVLDELAYPFAAREQRGHDDHRARALGHAPLQLEPGKTAGRDQGREQPRA